MNPGYKQTTLVALRRAARFSQSELALRARLAQQTVSDLERGVRRGRRSTWRKLAEVLKVPAEVLRP